tara:strand:+ start:81 stop:278 length:198 start_codon:yes stop_codon:yes gene_type:complete
MPKPYANSNIGKNLYILIIYRHLSKPELNYLYGKMGWRGAFGNYCNARWITYIINLKVFKDNPLR